jgi:putative membrane protein insertion efficiency factor
VTSARRLAVGALTAALRGYQVAISPLMERRCRYYPTCSAYAVAALKHHGVIKGLGLAVWRLLRCNPWSRGGVDYAPGTRPPWSILNDAAAADGREAELVGVGVSGR